MVLLAAPKFLGYTKDAKVAALQADVKVLENAALLYSIDHDDSFPIGNIKNIAGEALAGVISVPVYVLDEDELKTYIKGTKNPMSEYVMDADGNVYHISGQEDSKGDTWFKATKETNVVGLKFSITFNDRSNSCFF